MMIFLNWISVFLQNFQLAQKNFQRPKSRAVEGVNIEPGHTGSVMVATPLMNKLPNPQGNEFRLCQKDHLFGGLGASWGEGGDTRKHPQLTFKMLLIL